MELIKACRICLVTGVKMNDLRCYPVVNYCEAIVGMTDPVVMDLPPYACYECTAHIRNTFFFKERCLRGQATLYQILRLTGKITETSINSVDRLNLNLISNLKHYTIADNSINISNEDIDECEVKDEPCNEFDLQEVKDVVVEGDDVFKDEIEFDDAASPVHFSSDDDDEPLSIHKSNSDKVHKKTEKKKGRKRKADVSAEIKDEEAMEEGNLEVEESGSSPTKKRGRPKKGEARPKKAQPSMSRRTRNTGGVEDNEINLEEYVTVIKLSKEEQLEEIEKRQHSSNYRNSQYKCDQCFKGFIDADAWQHHVSKHKPDEKPSGESSANEQPEKPSSESTTMEQTEHSSSESITIELPDNPSSESPTIEQPKNPSGESCTNKQPVTLNDEPASDTDSDEGQAQNEENVVWTLDQTFTNAAEAESALEEMGTWTYRNSHYTEGECKKYYMCTKFRKLGAKCPASIYLLFHPSSKSVGMYKYNGNHDHEPKNQTKHIISEALKTEIKNMFERDMTAEEIMSEIQGMRQHKVPEMSQIKAYLGALRRAKLEEKTINLQELKAWINMRKNIPQNPEDVFVISDMVNEDDAEFLFVLSSNRLLEIANEADVIHIDSRHKLMWQGFSVYVVGTTDRAHKFHPLCLAVTSREQKDDFKLIFEGLINRVEELFDGVTWKPRVLICDAAPTIQNACVEVFGDDVVIRTSWDQVHREISHMVNNRSLHSKLFDDIESLQTLTRSSAFVAASKAFLKKYKDLTEFVTNFEEKFLVQDKNWYLGAAKFSPCSNGALESFIRWESIEPQLDQCQFLEVTAGLINKWSTRYNIELGETYIKNAPISTWEWTKSYNWANMYKELTVMRRDENYIYYKVPSSEATDFEMFDAQPESFKGLIKKNNSRWFVTLPVKGKYWRKGRCDCPAFCKNYICKHVVGIAIRLGHAAAPAEAQVRVRTRRYSRRSYRRWHRESDDEYDED